jgi:predicted dehydrogenase
MIKVGLVGCGGICLGAHLPGYAKIKEADIVAVCDIRPGQMDLAEEKIGKPVRKYTDYKEMIETETLDMVDICTPNYLHADVAIFALEHGVHAFSEKPDTISVERVLDMQKAAQQSGKQLMVMRNNRYWPSSKELKARIDSGEFGEIYTGRCGWQRKRGIPGKGGWFTTKAQSGGGPLIDLGVHMIDLAIYLMGNPKAVAVSGCTYQKFADNTDKADSVNADFGEKKDDGTFDVEDLAIGFIALKTARVCKSSSAGHQTSSAKKPLSNCAEPKRASPGRAVTTMCLTPASTPADCGVGWTSRGR